MIRVLWQLTYGFLGSLKVWAKPSDHDPRFSLVVSLRVKKNEWRNIWLLSKLKQFWLPREWRILSERVPAIARNVHQKKFALKTIVGEQRLCVEKIRYWILVSYFAKNPWSQSDWVWTKEFVDFNYCSYASPHRRRGLKKASNLFRRS